MPASPFPSSVHTLVVGAGFAGIAAAIAVHRANPSADVLLIERADEVGGTWRDNTYPGCACDVPTSLYSFSFAPSSEWSHTFARQPEIHRYLRHVVDANGLRPHLLTGCGLLGARWNDATHRFGTSTPHADRSRLGSWSRRPVHYPRPSGPIRPTSPLLNRRQPKT